MHDDRGRHVGERVAGQQDVAGPLEVLRHRRGRERPGRPYRATNARAHVVEDTRVEPLDRRKAGEGVRRQPLGRSRIRAGGHPARQVPPGEGAGVRPRDLTRVRAGHGRVVTKRPHERREPPGRDRHRVLHHQHDELAARRLDPEVARQAVVERRAVDLHQPADAAAHQVDRPVGGPGIDGDGLKREVGPLRGDCVEQGRQRGRAVERRDDDRDERCGHSLESAGPPAPRLARSLAATPSPRAAPSLARPARAACTSST